MGHASRQARQRAAVIGLARVRREFEVAQQHAEEEVRAEFGDRSGRCSCRSSRGPRARRARVRARDPCRRRRASAPARPASASSASPTARRRSLHHVVVVVAAGVARDAGLAGAGRAPRPGGRRPARRRARCARPRRACAGRHALPRCARDTPSRRGGRARSRWRKKADSRVDFEPRDPGAVEAERQRRVLHALAECASFA